MGTKSEELSWSREEEETQSLRERDALRLIGTSILSEDISRVREDLDMIVCRFLASKGWEMTPHGWTKAIGDLIYSCASSSALAVQSFQDSCDASEIDSDESRAALRSAAESASEFESMVRDDERNRCSARVKALVEASNGRGSMFVDVDLVIDAINGSEVSGG